jgi:hypothetical protein
MTAIKAGDFVSDFGKFCYVAMVDSSYNPNRVVLVDLKNKVSLQDINSLQLLEEDQLDNEDLEIMKSWAEKAKQSYIDMQNPNKKSKDEA